MPDKREEAVSAVPRERQTEAVTVRHRRISFIWIVPLLTVIAVASLLWEGLRDRGTEVTLLCDSADGIEAGKTLVKYRSVTVGRVEAVSLTEDFRRTEITVRIDAKAEDLLSEDAVFWVVRPRVELRSISGLDTLLSGAYIQIYQGKSAVSARRFELQTNAPIINVSERHGIRVKLNSRLSKRLEPGDLVHYRGFEVGVVLDARLNVENSSASYEVFIDEPYARLIHDSTEFWINSGIDMSLGPGGLKVNTENLTGILTAAVAFDDFGMQSTRQATDGDEYELYENLTSARLASLNHQPRFVVFVEDDLGALSPGSRVELRGMPLGEVIAAPWYAEGEAAVPHNLIPVMFALLPDRDCDPQVKRLFEQAYKEGRLSASLSQGLLVTGSELAVSTDDPDSVRPMSVYQDLPVIPFKVQRNLIKEMNSLAARLNEIDYAGISERVKAALDAVTSLMGAFNFTATSINSSGTVKDLNKALKDLQRTLEAIRHTADEFSSSGKVQEGIGEALRTLNQMLRDLLPAARELGQNPSTLIFGDDSSDPVPRVRRR